MRWQWDWDWDWDCNFLTRLRFHQVSTVLAAKLNTRSRGPLFGLTMNLGLSSTAVPMPVDLFPRLVAAR